MKDQHNSGWSFGCGSAVALLAMTAVCLVGWLWYRGGQERREGDVTWTLEAPAGRSHGLWTEDALTSENSCPGCLIGELKSGTKLRPVWPECKTSSWDSSYRYCHVLVLSGVLEGEFGWVNEDFVRK